MPKLIDLTGQRFGRLTVIERAGSQRSTDGFAVFATWRCICDCGNETVVLSNSLRNGLTKSCGCLRSDVQKERWRKK